jgi:hypothetical protein
MLTLKQFLDGSDVAMRSRRVTEGGEPAHVITEPWAAQLYACELHTSNGERPVRAIIGSDNGAPDLRDVLDTVAAEAAVAEAAEGYEQWAAQMGFNPDSRSGERVYRAARRQAKLLRQLLGDQRYQRLLWQTERL